MKKISLLLLFLIVGLAFSPIQEVKAQNIAGDYQVRVKGTNYYLDITPAERPISDRTTMKITQAGEKITVTFGTFASAMATTSFKGMVGNHLMCAVWWYQGSPHETKVLWGEVSRDGRTITGKLIYPRVSPRAGGEPGTPRFVPGWVEVDFTATKKGVARPTKLKEDCISFDYRKAEVKKIRGRWKIVVGTMWLKDFGDSETEARQALRIIKHYRMNKQCFVGRPDPSMEYYLAKNKAPTGSFTGEDCVPFNPANIEVRYIGGRWKIIEGAHWIIDFGGKEAEARTALKIIKKYGFDRICFVGRPDPSMTYFTCYKKESVVAKPDLTVTRMRAVREGKNCYLQVTIKNAGTAGVPESAYHSTQGAAIQMWKGTKAWGGIRLFGADPTKKLKTAGASVVHDWFPGAANLRFTGTATFKCEVDNNHVVDELNEGNNTLTKRLTCKADGGAGAVLKVIYPTNSQDFKIVSQKLVITVKFNRPVNPATVTARNSFKVWTGRDSNAAGALTFSDGNKTVKWTSTRAYGDLLIFDPDGFFKVILDGTGANAIKDADGRSLDGDKNGSPGGDFSHEFVLIG